MDFNFVSKPKSWQARAWRVAPRIISGEIISEVAFALVFVLAGFGLSAEAWAVPSVATPSPNPTVNANTTNNVIDLSTSITGITTPFTGITVGTAANGTVTGNTAGATTVTYTPNANFSGTDSFTYTATDSNGTSVSATVNITVTPVVPGQPTIGTATGGPSSAKVAFTATGTGGAAITGYTVTPYIGATAGTPTNVTTLTSPISVAGLVNGTSYTFTVAAINIAGTGPASGLSNAVTPANTLPGPPTAVTATASNLSSSVSFTAPAATGLTVTYTAAALTGGVPALSSTGVPITATGTKSPITVTGLTNGTAYTFTIVGSNSLGPGTVSAQSAAVTPMPTGANATVSALINPNQTVITPVITGTAPSSVISISTAPTKGTAIVSGNTILYTPNSLPLHFGTDSLKYQIIPSVGATGTFPAAATITIVETTNSAGVPTMVVQPNTPTTLDLTPYIFGTAITGISISTQPAHGSTSVYGTKVTYTPNKDYFGTDSFFFVGYGGGAPSVPTNINVTISGRPDPTKDARVTGLVSAQTAAVTHFSTAQLLNFQQRMESRHQAMHNSSPVAALTDSGNSPSSTGGASVSLGTAPAFFGSGSSGQRVGSFNSWQPNTMLAYANDPNAMLHAPDRLNNGQPVATDMVSTLMSLVTGLAMNSSLNLGTISNAVGAKQDDGFGRLDLWAAGNLRFGTSTQGGTNTQFSTDGVSVGVDKRLNRNLTVGMGIGYARDNSTVGTDGTNNKARGDSLALYASYLKDSGTFIDGLLGYGNVIFDTNRYDTAASDFARASRKGRQIFGSVSLGYESHRDALLWSPYGRYDFSYDRLNEGTESGVGTNALSYASQNVHSSSLALGMRVQSAHQTEYGVVQPRARIEYQHGLEKIGQTSVAYADLLATQYAVAGTSQNTHSVVIGLGSDFLVSNTLKFGIDYQHLGSNGAENYQSISFLLTKTLQGKNDLQSLFEESESSAAIKPTGMVVEAGYAFDSNVTRDTLDKLSDSIYSLMLSKSKSVVLAKRHRLTVTGFLDTEMFRNYAGLDHVMGGLQGEYAYRYSGAYGSPTYAIFTRLTEDKFNSQLRNGTRRSAGVSFRDELTNAINIYSALSANARTGKSEVFNTHDQSARVNLDYELDQDKTLYVTGEYQKGDFVSSGRPSLQSLEISNWSTKDDVFNAQGFNDYRFKGHSALWTLGYNVSFGSKDSFDISWRHAKTTADLKPATGLPVSYIDNLYSINYLMSF